MVVQANKNILALDQSSNINGYAIFQNGQLIKYGLIKLGSGKLGKRLLKLKEEISNLIITYNITEILFEDIQLETKVTNSVKTYKTLSEVIGVLEEILTEMKIPYTIVPAPTWRRIVGIKGSRRAEQKKNAQTYIYNKIKVGVTEDEADAICIGLSYYMKDTEKEQEGFDWS